ncbi:MAG: DMT family transporter [Bdellovibrio sp.]
MNFYLLLPILTGITIVSQATMNKMAAGIQGFSTTVLVNGIVFFIGCLTLWAGVKLGWIPWTGSMGAGPIQLSWRTIIPGFCGLAIVIGTPIALMNLGAALTFSLVIATQLFLGILIDVFLEGKTLSWPLVAGSATMLVGCLLILNAEKLK